jgi:hypothetical protein
MKSILRYFDRFLRWALGVFEFCEQPGCLLRLRQTTAAHAITLPDRCIPPGAPILELHLWNEHIPSIPSIGADLSWALQIQRRLITSFRTLARQMQRDSSLTGVQAVGGVTVLTFSSYSPGGAKLFKRLGFTVCPHHNPLGRFGEFWENLYTWAIMWVFNEASLQRRRLLWLHRSEIWMTSDNFLQRYSRKQ